MDIAEFISPDIWVTHFLRANIIHYDYKTDSLCSQGARIDEQLILSQMRLELYRTNLKQFRSYLLDALYLWKHKEQYEAINKLSLALSYSKDHDNNFLKKWIIAVVGKDSELDFLVMKHWLWQIKRKLNHLPVEHHMMPILYGKSGIGKSVAVQKLIEPLLDFTLFTSMNVFNDPFAKRQFSRNFIMFFDELEGANKVDISKLKQIITAPYVDWRGIRSEKTHSSVQNSTFIGCSNIPIKDQIHDPTSSRRFWQINCAKKIDWSVINKTEYLSLWKSVNENGPSPILPVIKEIKKVQEAVNQQKNSVEQWFSSCCSPSQGNEFHPTTKQLFDSYTRWCKENLLAPECFSPQGLSHQLDFLSKEKEWPFKKRHEYNGTTWPVVLLKKS